MKKVAIVVPTQKANFSQDEQVSFRHLNEYLGRYDKYLVVPDHRIGKKVDLEGFEVVHFSSEYFASLPKYCEMLNRKEFYQLFTPYEYILIYQPDVIVLSDQLDKWCSKGYDYVGPPWFHSVIGWLSKNKTAPLSGGNGGFSLRKVESFIKVIEEVEKEARRKTDESLKRKLWFLWAVITGKSHRKWLKAPAYCYPFNEDGFWSFEAPKYLSTFKVAPFSEALQFGFEKNPRRCFNLNHQQLPFGIHAWARYDREFWSPYLLTDQGKKSASSLHN